MTERVVVPFVSMRAKKVRKHLFVEKGSMHRVKDVMRNLVNFVEMIEYLVNCLLVCKHHAILNNMNKMPYRLSDLQTACRAVVKSIRYGLRRSPYNSLVGKI